MRIGHLEKSILSILLKHGAKTRYELARQIENVDISRARSRSKSFSRAIKQLQDKNLIRSKPYFKYEDGFCLYMENWFWAEGTYWHRYHGSGFFREKTRHFNYGFYHIFGLTHEGHERARADQSVPYSNRPIEKKVPRARAKDTIEDLHADDMLSSGKPWIKPRHRKKKE